MIKVLGYLGKQNQKCTSSIFWLVRATGLSKVDWLNGQARGAVRWEQWVIYD